MKIAASQGHIMGEVESAFEINRFDSLVKPQEESAGLYLDGRIEEKSLGATVVSLSSECIVVVVRFSVVASIVGATVGAGVV